MISDITVIYSNNNLFIRKQAIYLLIRIDYYLLECCILFFNLMNLLSAYQVIYFEMKSIFWRSTMRNISRNKFWWYAADKINKLMSYIHLKFAFLKIVFIERVIILIDIKLLKAKLCTKVAKRKQIYAILEIHLYYIINIALYTS